MNEQPSIDRTGLAALRAVPVPSGDRAAAGPSPARLPRPHLDLRVALRTAPPGIVELEEHRHHLLRVHAGDPVSGVCSAQQAFVYTRGDVDILPAGQSDSMEVAQASTALEVEMPPSLLRRAAEEMGLDPDRSGLEPRHQLRDPQIEHIAWALDADRVAGHPAGRLYTDTLGLALAMHLLSRHAARIDTRTDARRGLSRPQLRRLIDFIDLHLDEDLSLARLAGIAGTSASHLKTLFRRSTGLPVHEYVVQRRVERARLLLVAGELPASQVALEAGFSHQSHMARHMRRLLGVTPKTIARGAR